MSDLVLPNERPRAQRFAAVLAALAVPLAFVLWDLIIATTRAPRWDPSPLGLAVFAVAAWGVGATLALCLGLARLEVHRRIPRATATLLGALDGLMVGLFIVVGHNPASLQSLWRRLLAVTVAAVAGAVAGRLVTGERNQKLAAAVAVLLCVFFVARLSPNGDVFPRLLLTGVTVVAAAHLLLAVGARPRWLAVGSAVAVACGVLATPMLAHDPVARAALAQRSVHGRTWTEAVTRIVDLDGDRATNLFGEQDCDTERGDIFPGATEIDRSSEDGNCSGAVGDASNLHPHPSSASGTAEGSDVLILSVDSLRFDVWDELVQTRAVLGPHARLQQAVSPAAATVHSVSATLRGRLWRQIRLDQVAHLRGRNPVFDLSPTLATVLADQGYRAITVPTHRYLEPDTRVLAGFEAIASQDEGRFVPAESVARQLGPVVENSSEPLCLFVHYMESHHPFRYGGNVGPDSIEGLRAAVGYVDAAMAALIQDVRATRGRAPIVVIFGDHGEEFGEHGGRAHGSTAFAEQVRVPLLIAGPGVPEGDFGAPVSTAAVPRTVLELLGIPAPESMTVASLMPYLTGEGPAPQVAVSEVRSLRQANGYTFEHYRLLFDPVRGTAQLFDIREDPLEQRDLAGAEPALAARLIEQVRAWDEAR